LRLQAMKLWPVDHNRDPTRAYHGQGQKPIRAALQLDIGESQRQAKR
jgi:hypothetical protein